MKTAYIPINFGAPEKIESKAIKAFLYEFLSDRYVIDLPSPLRKCMAALISNLRWKAYSENLEGTMIDGLAPIKFWTESIATNLRHAVPDAIVEPAYRYPNMKATVAKLRKLGTRKFVFLPLYPQNSYSMTQSARAEALRQMRTGDVFIFKQSYHAHPLYIDALANSLKSALADGVESIICSYHSIPVSHLKYTHYEAQCKETTKLIYRKLERDCDMLTTWQSKSSRGKWLEPSTKEAVKRLYDRGHKKIGVICPGFSCDCTETLIEINRDLRAYAEGLGMEFTYVPCLNSGAEHIEMLKTIFTQIQ